MNKNKNEILRKRIHLLRTFSWPRLADGSALLVAGLETVKGGDILEINIEGAAGGHYMVVVDELLGLLLGGVLLDDLLGVSLWKLRRGTVRPLGGELGFLPFL